MYNFPWVLLLVQFALSNLLMYFVLSSLPGCTLIIAICSVEYVLCNFLLYFSSTKCPYLRFINFFKHACMNCYIFRCSSAMLLLHTVAFSKGEFDLHQEIGLHPILQGYSCPIPRESVIPSRRKSHSPMER